MKEQQLGKVMWRCCDTSQVGANSRNICSGHLTHLRRRGWGGGCFLTGSRAGLVWGQNILQMGTLPTTSTLSAAITRQSLPVPGQSRPAAVVPERWPSE